MQVKRPKKPIDITSKIKFTELFDKDDAIRLNPFDIGGKTYRVVGTRHNGKESYSHQILCEQTRKFVWTNDAIIRRNVIMKKNKDGSIPLIKQEDHTQDNPTIEDHKKKHPNQSNIFDEIPDVKIEKKQTKAKR